MIEDLLGAELTLHPLDLVTLLVAVVEVVEVAVLIEDLLGADLILRPLDLVTLLVILTQVAQVTLYQEEEDAGVGPGV